ncbi:hypothetical protein [Shewanella xiamenensis]|uniref:hypothetical protein n=1 Tax=Shewanella xiamenensis TaxID=332186 RepID=UPI0011853877|nr:hypothetical protein [Shewanella xiamenensis]
MRQSNRQKHLKHQHKSTQIRRKHYFHAAQQNLQTQLKPTTGFSSLVTLMQELKLASS